MKGALIRLSSRVERRGGDCEFDESKVDVHNNKRTCEHNFPREVGDGGVEEDFCFRLRRRSPVATSQSGI